MKKGKILSVLTSLAMTGSMILSAVPFTASAASPVGLELNSPKVEYSLDEIKAGATATVYVDVNTEFSSDEGVTIVEFNLTPDEWGTVDPVNLELCDPSYLATNDGSYFEYDNIDTSGSSAGSIWTKDVPETYFPIYDFYGDSNGTFAYDDAHPAKACLMTNSTLGYFRTGEGDGEHIAKFDVEFPTDLAEGTYTINLTGTRTAINTNPADVTALKWVDIENPGSITFTIGDGDVTTTTTTTDEPDVTTGTTLAKKYDAECDIWIEDQIKGEAGSKVLVPLWMDMHGETHESLGLQINYDNTALTLNKVYNSKQAGYDGTGFGGGSLKSSIKQDEGNVVILYVLKGDTPITNDPNYPVCVLEFTVGESATGEFPLTMVNQFNPDEPIEVVHVTGSQGSSDTYFTPIVDNGSILVGDAEVTTTTKEPDVTTGTTLSKQYDAECDIWIEDQIKGEAGSKVLVPLWMDMHGETHESLGLQINYDNTALTLNKVYNSKQAGYDGTGFEGGSLKSSIKQDEGNVVILYVLKGDTPITNDPKYPVCVLEFTVSDSATGEYPLTMVNQFNPDEPIEVVHVTGSQGSPDMYFTPIVDNGSILVGEEGTTSSSSGTTTTTTTTTTTSISSPAPSSNDGSTAKPDVVTSVSVVTSLEVVTVESVVTVTSIVEIEEGVTSIVPVTSLVTVESIVTKESIVTVTSLVPVESVVTVTSIVEVEEGVTSIVPVTSLVTVNSIVTVESIVTKESVVTVTSLVTFTSMVTNTSMVTYTSVVTNLQGVTSMSVVSSMVTVTSVVPVTSYVAVSTDASTSDDVNASSTVSSSEPATSKVSISIDMSALEVEGNDSDWYFADEEAWHLDGILVNGEAVDASALTFSFGDKKDVKPMDVYDGENFDYEITVTYTDKDGNSGSATFMAKIGQRGDATLDHKVAVRDAAKIASDLAQLYKTQKTTLDPFGVFLANSDYVYGSEPGKGGVVKEGKETEHYGIYDLAVRDAANLANYLAKVYKNPDLTLKDVAVK